MSSILVVDDEYVTHRIINVILGGKGYTILSAYNGLEALEQLAIHPVDMILTDVSMPYMDGLELIKHVRAETDFASLPIVIISASPNPEVLLEGLEIGANAFISQPFSSWELAHTVASFIEARQPSANNEAPTGSTF